MIQLLFTQTYASHPSTSCERFLADLFCRGSIEDVAPRTPPQEPTTIKTGPQQQEQMNPLVAPRTTPQAATVETTPRQQTPLPKTRNVKDDLTLEDVSMDPLHTPDSSFHNEQAAPAPNRLEEDVTATAIPGEHRRNRPSSAERDWVERGFGVGLDPI